MLPPKTGLLQCCNDSYSNSELLSVILTGDYPTMTFKRMGCGPLERFITRLVRYSSPDREAICTESSLARPDWWPKHVEFALPISSLRPECSDLKSLHTWTSLLRDIIACCSRYYKVQILTNKGTKKIERPVLALKQDGDNILDNNLFNFDPQVNLHNSYIHTHRNNGVEDMCKDDCYLRIFRPRPTVKLCDVAEEHNDFIKKSNPVVELCDILRRSSKRRRCKERPARSNIHRTQRTSNYIRNTKLLSIPEIHLHPIVQLYDICKLRRKKQRKAEEKKPVIHTNSYVRLHDIFEVPKPIIYNKEDYMNYFKLVPSSQVPMLNLPKCKITHNRTVKTYNFDITSEFGQKLVPMSEEGHGHWKQQRLEWFLKEMPQAKSNPDYEVSCNKTEPSYVHIYKPPRRQNYQRRMTLRLYYQLKMCKPICVRLERLDFRKLQNKNQVLKYLK